MEIEYACYLILYCWGLGWLRGLGEAITMLKPDDFMHDQKWQTFPFGAILSMELGPRAHKFFRKYHLIDLGKDAMILVLGHLMVFFSVGFDLFDIYVCYWVSNWAVVLLMLVVIWSAYEFAYVYGRQGTFISQYAENINFGDVVDPDESKVIKWLKERGDDNPVRTWNQFMHIVRLTLVIILLTIIG